MAKMSREDRLALLNSEVYQELELNEINKRAQTLSDKIVQSPTTQNAIRDGIAKALENKADDKDIDFEEAEFKNNIQKLNAKELTQFFNMLADGLEAHGIDPADALSEHKNNYDGSDIEIPDDIEEIEHLASTDVSQNKDEVMDYVKTSLIRIAYDAADSGNTEAAYLIERLIQKIS